MLEPTFRIKPLIILGQAYRVWIVHPLVQLTYIQHVRKTKSEKNIINQKNKKKKQLRKFTQIFKFVKIPEIISFLNGMLIPLLQ